MMWIAFTCILPYSSHSAGEVMLTSSCISREDGESDASTVTVVHGTKGIQPQEELQNIISQLEEGNRCMVTFAQQILMPSIESSNAAEPFLEIKVI